MHRRINGKIALDINHARKEFKEINQIIDDIIVSEVEPFIYNEISNHLENYLDNFNHYYNQVLDIYNKCLEQQAVYEIDLDNIVKAISEDGFLSLLQKTSDYITNEYPKLVNEALNNNENIIECFKTLYEIINGFKIFGKTKEYTMTQLMLKQINTKLNNYLTLVVDENCKQYINILEFTKEQLYDIVVYKMTEVIETYSNSEEQEESIKKIFSQSELEKLVKNNGYELKRQTGSHRIYKNEDGKNVIIPFHKKELGKGLSMKIQKTIIKQN